MHLEFGHTCQVLSANSSKFGSRAGSLQSGTQSCGAGDEHPQLLEKWGSICFAGETTLGMKSEYPTLAYLVGSWGTAGSRVPTNFEAQEFNLKETATLC